MGISFAEHSSALLSAAAWTEPRPPEPVPVAWLELRDTASAIRLAVQILRGPYALIGDGEMQARAREVLQSLEQSTRRLCDLVATVQPPANDAGPSARTVAAVAEPARVVEPIAEVPRLREVVPPPATLAAVRSPAKPAKPRPAAGPRPVEIDELLAKLEIVVGTRAAAPLVLTIVAPPQLSFVTDAAELLRTLVLMVEDVGPVDGTVDLRVFLDPTEDLGEALDVVFEVRARASASAPSVSAPLRAASDGIAGRLTVRRTSTTSALSLRLACTGA